MRNLFYSFVLALLLAGCGGLAGDPVIVATLPPEAAAPAMPPDVASGAQLFAQHCTACHGINGAGDGELVQSGQIPAMPSFLESAHVGAQTPQDYYRIITNGNLQKLMPPWNETLTEQERWNVAMYVYTLAYTPQQLSDGERAAAAVPADALPDTESLYAQSDADLFATLKNRAGNTLSDSDLRDFVAYWRTSNFAGGALTPEVTAEPLPENITIRGTVTNNTAGAAMPEELAVSLRYGNLEAGIQSKTTIVQADGSYSFENVPVNAEFAYVTVAFYQERPFASDVLTATELDAVTELPINLYEITEDPFNVTITQIDTSIQPHQVSDVGTGLVFTQRITFHNASDRAYSLSRPLGEGVYPSVVWQLPPGAIVLNLDNPSRYVVSEEQNIIVDTQFLPPGDHTMQVIYFVPYSDGAVIDQPVTNAIDGTLNFTLTPETLTLIDDRLQRVDAGSEAESGAAAGKVYTGTVNIPFGTAWKYEIRGSLFASTDTIPGVVTADTLLPVLLIGIVLVVVIVGAYLLLKGGQKSNPNQEINALVRQIAELDTLHNSGQINHDAYQQQRQVLKARLASLMSSKTAPQTNGQEDVSS